MTGCDTSNEHWRSALGDGSRFKDQDCSCATGPKNTRTRTAEDGTAIRKIRFTATPFERTSSIASKELHSRASWMAPFWAPLGTPVGTFRCLVFDASPVCHSLIEGSNHVCSR